MSAANQILHALLALYAYVTVLGAVPSCIATLAKKLFCAQMYPTLLLASSPAFSTLTETAYEGATYYIVG